MELTKAEARLIRNDLLRCTEHIKRYLNGLDSHLCLPLHCFEHIGDRAKELYLYIDNNNDVETAKVLVQIDRAVWQKVQNDLNLQKCEDVKQAFVQLAKASAELFKIQNWYLETVYNIPVEAIGQCEYYVHPSTGEVRNSKTQEVIPEPEPQPKETEQRRNGIVLPEELNTPEANTYFNRALDKGWITGTGNGLKWNRKKVELAYFCYKVFCPTKTEQFPEASLNKLFGVNRLQSALYQMAYRKKTPKWTQEINSIFG